MVQLGGFEPPTSGATIQRSNQLSYNCKPRKSANDTFGPMLVIGRYTGKFICSHQILITSGFCKGSMKILAIYANFVQGL